MMDLDSAIQHCREQVQEQAKKGCYSCAEEHQQLAEWLKDYKRLLGESGSEIPNTCGDAISREAAIRAIEALQRPIMREESNYYQFKFSGMSEALGAVENLPSVTPQQRTGRWVKQNYGWNWQCSECGFVTPPSAKEIFTFCPKCGAKMVVEE